MIYERITPTTIQRTLYLDSMAKQGLESVLSMTRQSLSTSILATCHPIRQEAEPYVLKTLAALEQEPIRVQCSMADLWEIFELVAALHPICDKHDHSSMLGPIFSLCSKHWDHICEVPRTSPHSRHHLEIALSTPPTFDTRRKTLIFDIRQNKMFDIWMRLFYDVEDSGLSCAIYHKGNLHSVPRAIETTGMAFWLARRSEVIPRGRCGRRSPISDEVGDSILKVVEMDEEEWERMVEEWDTE